MEDIESRISEDFKIRIPEEYREEFDITLDNRILQTTNESGEIVLKK